MPIPSTTTSFANIQNELGGTIPISLSEYYNVNGKFGYGILGIPTSGQISVNHFRGKSKIINVNITGSGFTIINAYDDSNYNYAFFTNNSTFIIDNVLNCDILIVGGGGGGGNSGSTSWESGGGGAGGVVYMINKQLNSGTYNIVVGGGGAGNTNGNDSKITDSNNNNISIDSIILIGKGGGRGATNGGIGGDGGSGGGGTHPTTNGGLATQGNTFWNGSSYIAGGFNGAKPTASSRGGGGGGAGEIGDIDGIGFGGDGVLVNITGNNTFYAGGGNTYPNTSTISSDGGGGIHNSGNGLANTGSGGGGGYGLNGNVVIGGTGGSGVVIIRYKNNYNKNYPILKEKRQYPPKLYDSSTTETTNTGELTGINPITYYKETFTINSYSNGYGIGTYIIYSSSTYGMFYKSLLFNFNNSDNEGAHWSITNTYSQPLGNYIGSSYIKSDYTGDWIILKLPNSIILNMFIFYLRTSLVSRCPALWKCYGSNDGITFTEILEASNTITALTSANYSSGFYQQKITSFSTSYSYIGFTFNKLVGGDTNACILNFSEIKLFGNDDTNINPTAWYKFDDNTNIGLDSSGNGYHLTNNGSVSFDNTNFIKGISASLFNGSNNLQRAYTGNLFSDQSGWSLSFWVYLRKPSGLVSLISTRLTDTSTLRGFNWYFNNVGDFSFQIGNDLSYNWYYPFNITGFYTDAINFKWFHFVLTMKSGEQRLYSNGILIGSDSISQIPNFQNGSSIFTIGSASYGDFYVQNGFRYDDVRYYGGGRILTQAHVSQLYNGVS